MFVVKSKKSQKGKNKKSQKEMAHAETPDAAGQQKSKSKNALYVGDLDKDVDEGFLYQIFSKVNAIANTQDDLVA